MSKPETLKIGIVHCGIPENMQTRLLEHIRESVMYRVMIELEIFCPHDPKYRDKITYEEKESMSYWPITFTIEEVRKMIERWSNEPHVIFASDPIVMHARNNGITSKNLRPIGGADDRFLNLATDIVRTFSHMEIQIDINLLMSSLGTCNTFGQKQMAE